MPNKSGSYLTGRIPTIDGRQKRIFNRAVQIARTRRNQREISAGTHLSTIRWRARYRGLVIEMTRFGYRDGTEDVSVRIRREKRLVFHLQCRRHAEKRRKTPRNELSVFEDVAGGDWERLLDGRE